MSFEIPITQHLESFNQHLESNSRTVFSAKFGDGKSFFLNEFKKQYEQDYYFITLYPVNYSIAENADIFEYIKRDIIIRLVENDDNILCNIDFEALAVSIFNMENLMEVVSFLVSFLPYNDSLQKIINKTKGLFKKYQEKKETYKDFLDSFTHQKGGLYECDAYTQMIEQALQYINKSKEKKTILIIEDLDRIDPAHLFRILNVLGAHIDCCNATIKPNKFGFNNIVTVFDYETTEHLFHHFYGKEANYSGYINKFIDHYPFRYSINQIAIDYLYKYIENECYISKAMINKFQIPYIKGESLEKRINKLSVRDIKQLLDNIENQIITEVVNINHNMKFHTLNSATKFLAILKRLNIHCNPNNISELFKDHPVLLNFINSFILLHIDTPDLTTVSFGSNLNFKINIQKDDYSTIIKTEFVQTNSRNSYCTTNLNKVINNGLTEALKYIKQ
jgi:hypothetical protein